MGKIRLFGQVKLTHKQANGDTKARPARTCSGGPDIDRHMCWGRTEATLQLHVGHRVGGEGRRLAAVELAASDEGNHGGVVGAG